MNAKFIFSALIFMSLLFFGCNNAPESGGNNTSKEQYDNPSGSLASLPDSVKQRLEAQDSLSKELVSQVEMLTNELKSAKTEVSELKSSLEEKNRQSMLWTILPIAISVIAFGISLIALRLLIRNHYIKEADYGKYFKIGLEKHGLLETKDAFKKSQERAPLQLQSSSSVDEKICNLESRLTSLESAIETKEKTTSGNNNGKGQKSSYSSNAKKDAPFSKRLYAKSIASSYLKEIAETKEETCAFVIELENENRGYFDIASFNQAKQLNGLDECIDYSGNCKIDEANNYTLKEKGICICEKQHGLWKVVEKLKITISK